MLFESVKLVQVEIFEGMMKWDLLTFYINAVAVKFSSGKFRVGPATIKYLVVAFGQAARALLPCKCCC